MESINCWLALEVSGCICDLEGSTSCRLDLEGSTS